MLIQKPGIGGTSKNNAYILPTEYIQWIYRYYLDFSFYTATLFKEVVAQHQINKHGDVSQERR